MQHGRVRFALGAVVTMLLLVSAAGTSAQEYPAKPIELVVPFVAGGGGDIVARIVADYVGKKWAQPVLVVNKPGGGGVPGARYALKEARPDGYTALVDVHTTSSMLVGAWNTPPLTLADRKYAGRIIVDPMVFAVKADAPWRDLHELSA
jgi:tripartite-type tricarboxylate transporter receptor subunit TctC